MVSKPSPPETTETAPPAVDDFKLINGIGPAIERCLHEAGVLTFAQLASMSPTEIVALLDNFTGLSSQRIAQQDWIGQARELAPEAEEAGDEADQAIVEAKDQQHYATFTVELLLDEQNNARRTRIVHIQTGEEKTWAGWEENQLLRFFIQRARLPEQPTTQPDRVARLTVESGLHKLGVVPASAERAHNLVQEGQPFDIHLTLELSKVARPVDSSLGYAAVVHAKDLAGGSQQVVGESRGTWSPADPPIIKLTNLTLPAGLYRLEAFATLSLVPAEPDLEIMLESSLLQVYS